MTPRSAWPQVPRLGTALWCERVEDIKRKMPLALVGKAVEAIKIIAIRSADQWLRAKRLCIQLLRIKRPSP
jgi:hypothetical protein